MINGHPAGSDRTRDNHAGGSPARTRPVPDAPARACCCPAKPQFKVMIPVADGQDQADLWLCGHHYRASRATLVRANARVEARTAPASR
jgi:hypothetical protein